MRRSQNRGLMIAGVTLTGFVVLCCGLPLSIMTAFSGTKAQPVAMADARPNATPPANKSQSIHTIPDNSPTPALAVIPPTVTPVVPPIETKSDKKIISTHPTPLSSQLPSVLPSPSRSITSAPLSSAIAFQESVMKRAIVRDWLSSDGKHRTKAKLLAFKGGQLTLAKLGGGESTVPLQRLSADDYRYVSGLIQVDADAKVAIGSISGVSDDNILTFVAINNSQRDVVLAGIKVPETGSPFARQAKQLLNDKTVGKSGWLEWKDKDTEGRPVGVVYMEGINVNLAMLAAGAAKVDGAISYSPRFANAEFYAERRKLGLWGKVD